MKLIAQGAEAKLFTDNSHLIKERVPKEYRLKVLDDKLRVQRTRSEVKILEKASKVISVPKVLSSNEKKGIIKMELIKGKKVAEVLDGLGEKKRVAVCKEIGKNIALLHNAEIIHGDLTT